MSINVDGAGNLTLTGGISISTGQTQLNTQNAQNQLAYNGVTQGMVVSGTWAAPTCGLCGKGLVHLAYQSSSGFVGHGMCTTCTNVISMMAQLEIDMELEEIEDLAAAVTAFKPIPEPWSLYDWAYYNYSTPPLYQTPVWTAAPYVNPGVIYTIPNITYQPYIQTNGSTDSYYIVNNPHNHPITVAGSTQTWTIASPNEP